MDDMDTMPTQSDTTDELVSNDYSHEVANDEKASSETDDQGFLSSGDETLSEASAASGATSNEKDNNEDNDEIDTNEMDKNNEMDNNEMDNNEMDNNETESLDSGIGTTTPSISSTSSGTNTPATSSGMNTPSLSEHVLVDENQPYDSVVDVLRHLCDNGNQIDLTFDPSDLDVFDPSKEYDARKVPPFQFPPVYCQAGDMGRDLQFGFWTDMQVSLFLHYIATRTPNLVPTMLDAYRSKN